MIATALAATAVLASITSKSSSATYQPAYVVEYQMEKCDVLAPSQAEAVRLANRYLCFPGSESNPINAYLSNGGPIPRPYWQPSDLRFHRRVWTVYSGKPPKVGPDFKTPTYDEWLAILKEHPEVKQENSFHLADTPARDCLLFNQDATVDWATLKNWKTWRVYVVTQRTMVWYYQADTRSQAANQARKDWLDGGVYALGRPLTWAESFYLEAKRHVDAGDPGWTLPPERPKTLDGLPELPKKPWDALLYSFCERTPVSYQVTNDDGTKADQKGFTEVLQFATAVDTLPQPPYDTSAHDGGYWPINQ